MTAWEWLRDLHTICSFQTREGAKVGKASNSELRRWIQNKALLIDGKSVAPEDELEFPLTSVILFPKHRITLL